jgi:RNA polymerase sigma-70 factor (ECF subfamily)
MHGPGLLSRRVAERLASILCGSEGLALAPDHDPPGDVTKLLSEWKAGRPGAGNELVSLTYAELRRLARSYLRRERSGHTLQATALLNEAYLSLLPSGPRAAENREAFFRLMASEMRHRLVDHARRHLAAKRGAGAIVEPLDTSVGIVAPEPDTELETALERLDRAVEQLAAQHPRAARVVQLRFFAALTTEETASELGLSVGTVKREWTFARAWLSAAIAVEQ